MKKFIFLSFLLVSVMILPAIGDSLNPYNSNSKLQPSAYQNQRQALQGYQNNNKTGYNTNSYNRYNNNYNKNRNSGSYYDSYNSYNNKYNKNRY
jgi:hypothetical protein